MNKPSVKNLRNCIERNWERHYEYRYLSISFVNPDSKRIIRFPLSWIKANKDDPYIQEVFGHLDTDFHPETFYRCRDKAVQLAAEKEHKKMKDEIDVASL